MAQAIEAVSPNGVLSPKEAKLCLAARSRLHLQLGNYTAALKDAEDALLDDPQYIRGLFAKAEALYFKSDFEFALISFYKGAKVRRAPGAGCGWVAMADGAGRLAAGSCGRS